jgi:hypothetical protein
MFQAVRKLLFNPTCSIVHSKGKITLQLDKIDQSIINRLVEELKPYGLFVCPLGANSFYIKQGQRIYASIKRGSSINIVITL